MSSTSRRLAWVGCLVALSIPSGAHARDEGADGRFSQRRSSHFLLLQDVDLDRRSGRHGSRRFEQDVLEVLESAFDLVREVLDLRPRREIRVLVYDAAIFDRSFGGLFRFGAAGFYHGVIRVRGDTRVGARLVRVLYHEYVHAAFDAEAPSLVLPGWVNEGVAEWMERRALGWRRPSPAEWSALSRLAASGELLPLATLSAPSFARLEGQRASVAYLQSYALVDHLVRRHGERALREFLSVLLRTRHLPRALRRAFGRDAGEIESDLLGELVR